MKLKIFLVALLLVSLFGVAGKVLAMTEAERQALIAQIQSQIAALTEQATQMLAQQQGTASWCHTFYNNLGFANSGSNEVVNLHIALQKEGISYSPDNINTYSDGTSAGVVQFQTRYGISPQSGYVGVKTRSILNQVYGCAETNDDNTTTTTNTNDCQANCYTQSDGVFAVDCYGYVTKCDTGDICEREYETIYTHNNGGVQTTRNLTGSDCVTPTVCTPDWDCADWSSCVNGSKTRTCVDRNNCGTTTSKQESQSCDPNVNTDNCSAKCYTQSDGVFAVDCYGYVTKCESGETCQNMYDTTYEDTSSGIKTVKTLTGTECVSQGNTQNNTQNNNQNNSCVPDWDCVNWSTTCVAGQQTRTCTDKNSCGTISGKPSESQACNAPCTSNWRCDDVPYTECIGWKQYYHCWDINYCGTASTTTANGTIIRNHKVITQPCEMSLKVNIKANNSEGPVTVASNSQVALTWTTVDMNTGYESGVYNCVASGGWSGSKNNIGSESVLVASASKTYTITCKSSKENDNRTVTDSVIVNPTSEIITNIKAGARVWEGSTIGWEQALSSMSFSDGPLNVEYGGEITLKWDSINATSCKALGNWSGTKTISGSETLSTKNNNNTGAVVKETYFIECSNGVKSNRDSVVVNMQPKFLNTVMADIKINNSDAPAVFVQAQPGSWNINIPIVLSWSSSNATLCTASGSGNSVALSNWGGGKQLSGSQSITFPVDTQNYYASYTITCSAPATDGSTGSGTIQTRSDTIYVYYLRYVNFLVDNTTDAYIHQGSFCSWNSPNSNYPVSIQILDATGERVVMEIQQANSSSGRINDFYSAVSSLPIGDYYVATVFKGTATAESIGTVVGKAKFHK